MDAFGKIDIVVNNAGALWGGYPEDLKLENWMRVLSINMMGTFLVSQKEYYEETALFVENKKRTFLEEMEGFPGLCIFPSTVHFLLLKLEGSLKAGEVCRNLRNHRILVRDCSNFFGLSDRFIRIALKTFKANRQCIEVLKELLV